MNEERREKVGAREKGTKRVYIFFFQAEDGIRDIGVTGVQTCALPIFVEEVSKYTLLAGIDPHLMLHIFLPVLIFESAYALDTHTFVKSFAQVVVLAVPCFCE